MGKKKHQQGGRETEFDDFANPLAGEPSFVSSENGTDGNGTTPRDSGSVSSAKSSSKKAQRQERKDEQQKAKEIAENVRDGGAVRQLVAVDDSLDLVLPSARQDLTGIVQLNIKRLQRQLTLTVLNASELRPMKDHDENDVFIELHLIRDLEGEEDSVQRTSTINNAGSDASWETQNVLTFQLSETDQEQHSTTHLLIRAVDEDFTGTNDIIGEKKIAMDELLWDGGLDGEDFEQEHTIELADSDFILSHFFVKLDEQASRVAEMAKQMPFAKEIFTFALHPSSKPKAGWDTWVLVLVFYSALYTPFQTVFYSRDKGSGALDDLVDICFWVDMGLNFWTGYDKGFEVVMEKSKVVKHYVQGWFIIDFIATVNWSDVWQWAFDNGENPPTWVSMLRLIKLLRLLRAGRIINNLTMTWSLHTKFIDAFNFFLYVVVVCHVLACFFYLWPELMTCHPDRALSNAIFMAADADDAYLTTGWHWNVNGDEQGSTCMQNSWRQKFGLEALCKPCDPTDLPTGTNCEDLWFGAPGGAGSAEPEDDAYTLRVCQETAEFGYSPGKLYAWSDRAAGLGPDYNTSCADKGKGPACETSGLGGDVGASFGVFEAKRCSRCMKPMAMWQDSFYWSLTTMTTIGYGDRGPSTEQEIVFVILAEFLGLGFFAIMLSQINDVNDVLGESAQKLNDQKNGVVQFLLHHQLDETLISESIRYLNFRATSVAGNAFNDDDSRFKILSPGIKRKIKIKMNRPVLERVRVFGWNPVDWAEERSLRDIFDDIDKEGTGWLSKDEMGVLFKTLNLRLNTKQFDRIFNELDWHNTGQIDYKEFKFWWYKKKEGRPHMDKCPPNFLDLLAEKVVVQAYDKDEMIVDHGEYGNSFGIIIQGTCKIWRDKHRKGHASTTVLKDSDREPVFGFMACVPEMQFEQFRDQTEWWSVEAQTYVDLAWVSREDMLWSFREAWAEGYADMLQVSYSHYEITEEIAKGLTPVEQRTDLLSAMEIEIMSAEEEKRVTAKAQSDLHWLQMDNRMAKQTRNLQAAMEAMMTTKFDALAADVEEMKGKLDILHAIVLDGFGEKKMKKTGHLE